MLDVLANILAGISATAASEGSARTIFFTFDEPECPQELI